MIRRLPDEHCPRATWCHLNAPRAAVLAGHAVCLFPWVRHLTLLLCVCDLSEGSPYPSFLPWLSEVDHPYVDFNFIIITRRPIDCRCIFLCPSSQCPRLIHPTLRSFCAHFQPTPSPISRPGSLKPAIRCAASLVQFSGRFQAGASKARLERSRRKQLGRSPAP